MQKRKTFRPWQPEQTTLLPPSPREWLSEDHQVYFLLDLVDELDLSAILIPAQAKDPRGEKGFDPRMMTLLLLYAYCVGTVSSRKIERACYEDLAFRVLTGNQQPDHSRISEFRRRNLDALKGLSASRKPRATPPAACRMGSHHHRNAARSPEMLMPKPAWPASSEAKRAPGSTPNARRSLSW